MGWVILDDNFPNHPKIVQVGPVAAWFYVCGVAYCRRFYTGGFIPAAAVKTLGVAANPRKLIDALIAVGLWERVDGGFRVHDYAVQYPDDASEKAHKEDRTQAKRDAGRKGGLASWKKRSGQAQPEAPAEASAEAEPEADVKHVASTVVQPHGYRDKDRRDPIFVEKERKGDPPFDVWAREFMGLYPASGRCAFGLVERPLFEALTADTTVSPWAAWDALKARLAGHIVSARWTEHGGKYIPRVDRYLREGTHLQVMPLPSATPRAGRTANNADEFRKFIERGQ